MSFVLTLKRAGWKMIYDPSIAVDHYPAQRFDEDQRHNFNNTALINLVHNETLILLEHFSPLRQIVFLSWSILVGTRESLGICQWLRLFPQQGEIASKKFLASLQGRWLGYQKYKMESQKFALEKQHFGY
jgi:GT2 family glycosyltransferase